MGAPRYGNLRLVSECAVCVSCVKLGTDYRHCGVLLYGRRKKVVDMWTLVSPQRAQVPPSSSLLIQLCHMVGRLFALTQCSYSIGMASRTT